MRLRQISKTLHTVTCCLPDVADAVTTPECGLSELRARPATHSCLSDDKSACQCLENVACPRHSTCERKAANDLCQCQATQSLRGPLLVVNSAQSVNWLAFQALMGTLETFPAEAGFLKTPAWLLLIAPAGDYCWCWCWCWC